MERLLAAADPGVPLLLPARGQRVDAAAGPLIFGLVGVLKSA